MNKESCWLIISLFLLLAQIKWIEVGKMFPFSKMEEEGLGDHNYSTPTCSLLL
jgi:hypothetical protein